MAKFYVGQRVRIKWSRDWPYLKGTEGTVCKPPAAFKSVMTPDEVLVAPDSWCDYSSPCGRSVFTPDSWQLEPILPPHEACDTDFKASLDELLSRVEEDA